MDTDKKILLYIVMETKDNIFVSRAQQDLHEEEKKENSVIERYARMVDKKESKKERN